MTRHGTDALVGHGTKSIQLSPQTTFCGGGVKTKWLAGYTRLEWTLIRVMYLQLVLHSQAAVLSPVLVVTT